MQCAAMARVVFVKSVKQVTNTDSFVSMQTMKPTTAKKLMIDTGDSDDEKYSKPRKSVTHTDKLQVFTNSNEREASSSEHSRMTDQEMRSPNGNADDYYFRNKDKKINDD